MIRTLTRSAHAASERKALWRRVHKMYAWFNHDSLEKCYTLLDPKLVDQSNIDPSRYAESLRAFKDVYGSIKPWHMQISLHLDASANKNDPRPFAYVYVIWKDEGLNFHMFKERWVKHANKWYTRVVGLVPNVPVSK
jgi:hypothetical protein